MNQGKLEVVKRDGSQHFRGHQIKMDWNGGIYSDDHYIYYCGQEALRRNGVATTVNKKVQNAVLGSNLKNDKMTLCSFPRQTIQ